MKHRPAMGQLPPTLPYSPPAAIIAWSAVDRAAAGRSLDRPATFATEARAPNEAGEGAVDASAVQTMVATAVRQVLDHPLPASDNDLPADSDDDAAVASPATFDAAVIAAHDQRIALLRERLTALCGTDGASPLLAGLRQRLERAEAARLVAIRRAGQSAMPGGGAVGEVLGCPVVRSRIARPRASPAVTLGGRAWRPPSALAVHVPHVRSTPGLLAAVRDAALPHLAPARRHPVRRAVRLAHMLRYLHPVFASRALTVRTMSVALVSGQSARHGTLDRPTAMRLAQARRSLAAARHALTSAKPAPTLRASPMLVGLWRWDGGDTWHLTAPSSAASRLGV